MICKDLFKYSNVVFVEASDNLQRQESEIKAYGNRHSIKININLGVWVNPTTTQAVRVLRLELIGSSNEERYPSRRKLKHETLEKREKRKEEILKLLKEGKNQTEIAKIMKCSKQAINQFIRYYVDDGK